MRENLPSSALAAESGSMPAAGAAPWGAVQAGRRSRRRAYAFALGRVSAVTVWVFTGLGATAVSAAAPAPLGEDDLRAAVSGKTVKIDTPLGLQITVNYGANGIMSGTAGTALSVYLGAPKDRGRWRILNGKLCQKWFKWLDSETTCLTIRQDGSKIFWRSDEGKVGTASIEPGPPVLAGASASGLGIPRPTEPPVDTIGAHGSNGSGAESGEIDIPDKSAAPAGAVSRRPGPAQAMRAASVIPARAVPAAAVRNVASPALIDDRAQMSRPVTPVEVPPVARFVVASLAIGSGLDVAATTAPTPITSQPDPFAADVLPMRQGADIMKAGILQHRWCHRNAFETGLPVAPAGVSAKAGQFDASEVPSLLSIAQQQLYDGELPLHEASCLTERPGIAIASGLDFEDR
jgi:hypothetical protein